MRKWENEEISKWGASYKLAPEEINFAKGASHTGSRSTAGEKKLANGEVLRDSEENEDFQKKTEESFDEKRV